jgi:hypothetical protein
MTPSRELLRFPDPGRWFTVKSDANASSDFRTAFSTSPKATESSCWPFFTVAVILRPGKIDGDAFPTAERPHDV